MYEFIVLLLWKYLDTEAIVQHLIKPGIWILSYLSVFCL